jgi:hypothetical protein
VSIDPEGIFGADASFVPASSVRLEEQIPARPDHRHPGNRQAKADRGGNLRPIFMNSRFMMTIKTVHLIRRKMTVYRSIPPAKRKNFHKAILDEILQERAVTNRNKRYFRGIKRKMSNFPLRPRNPSRCPRSTSETPSG